jgi:hypothetical protein
MSQVINDEFVDVDFEKQPQFVFGDLGMGAFGSRVSDYESTQPVLTDSQIMAEIEKIAEAGGGAERLVTRIMNQGREGSCVANAFTQANQVIQALQFGKHKVVPLSAISLYKRIGRSPGSGAMVSDGIEEMVERGILPLDTPENRARFGSDVMPATGFYEKYPSGWEDTAAKFKGGEYHVVRSVEGLFTALCCQHPVVVGREGHSICYLRPMVRNGRRVVMYVNSWGNWGSAGGDFGYGFGFDTESQVRKSASWAVAVRSVVIPSDLK